jgi:hypothetical protein
MTNGRIKVKCSRCGSTIEIFSDSIPADIFTCPVCMEGEIHYKADQPAMQPVAASGQKSRHLEQYITTPSNICTN